MSNKDSAFKQWETKEYSMCSTTLLQPNASASGISARSILASMAPYDLHKRLINDYILCRRGATSLLQRDTSRDKTDYDVIRENHRFLWDDEENSDTWEAQLAKKYYDKLYKEYCICDLTMYKQNKVAMRWRTEAELVSGRGQFSCGEKHCSGRDHLRTWEVNFAYVEHGVKKNALVKLRLCPDCTVKLNYGSRKREVKRRKNKSKRRHNPRDEQKDHKSKKQKTSNDKTLGNETEETVEDKEDNSEVTADGDDESKVWRETGKADEEKSREDEFEEYLEDLFV